MSSGYLPRMSYSPAASAENDTKRNSSVMSTSSIKNGLKTVAQKYKEHDRSVQNAWEAHYGVGQFSPYNSAEAKRNNSAVSGSSSEASGAKSPSAFKKAAKAVRQHIREHHESVNAAHSTLYGSPSGYRQRA